MAIDTTAADKAALAAQQALEAANAARDVAEIEWLGNVSRLQQITENRNSADATRLKSRYVSVFG